MHGALRLAERLAGVFFASPEPSTPGRRERQLRRRRSGDPCRLPGRSRRSACGSRARGRLALRGQYLFLTRGSLPLAAPGWRLGDARGELRQPPARRTVEEAGGADHGEAGSTRARRREQAPTRASASIRSAQECLRRAGGANPTPSRPRPPGRPRRRRTRSRGAQAPASKRARGDPARAPIHCEKLEPQREQELRENERRAKHVRRHRHGRD